MEVAIVGLPGSGKTTVFTALGGPPLPAGHAAGRASATVGVVKVPDERLDRLAEHFHPKKTTHADVTYLDVALPPGATKAGTVDADLLGRLRNADAFLHVARAFEDAAGPADPWAEVDELDLEFAVNDLDVVTRRLERLRTSGRHGSPAERDQNAREEVILDRLEAHLSTGEPLRSYPLTPDEERLIRGFRFLSQKPRLVILAIDEGRLPEAAAMEAEARTAHAGSGTEVAALASRIEAEIAALSAEDARLFLDDLGIAEASRGRVISLTYALLGLFSFFTAGEDECRAWTLGAGATALDAAGAIHSDLARGFIRAEVIGWQDLLECGSTAEARRRGLLRSEGKTYAVRDGDVIEVLFNVSR